MQRASEPPIRPDFASRRRLLADDRTPDRVVEHYRLERKLAERLRSATRETRLAMYGAIYKELFASLPDHPQRVRQRRNSYHTAIQLRKIRKELHGGSVFLEIGCGDATLGFAAAKHVRSVYGIDVTAALIDLQVAPVNFQFLPTDGVEIRLPDAAVDFAFSNQLVEHLHPDDAADQIREVCRVLKPGGRYMCITPSRVTGPHDVSCYFDYEATGLHLREYDYGALQATFRDAGFRTTSCVTWVRGHRLWLPYSLLRAMEASLMSLPPSWRARLTRPGWVQTLLGVNLIATK